MITDIAQHIIDLRTKATEYNDRADNLDAGGVIANTYFTPKTELHTVTCLNCDVGVFSTVKSILEVPLAINAICPMCILTDDQKADLKLSEESEIAAEEIATLNLLRIKYPNE